MQSTVWCFCFVLSIYYIDFADAKVEWRFGRESPGSYVIQQEKGTIQLLEKTKVIALNVPRCHQVSSVRVSVTNRLSTPSVTYDEDARSVTIAYTLLQVSHSDYDILVKGLPLLGCQPDKTQCDTCVYNIAKDYY